MMRFLFILLCSTSFFGISKAAAQVHAHNNPKGSEAAKGKSGTILISDFAIPQSENAALVLRYRVGSKKFVEQIHFNGKIYSNYAADTIADDGHTSGIIVIPLGKIEKEIKSDILVQLNDQASVRGFIASSYANVNQQKAISASNKQKIDSANSFSVLVEANTGDMIIDVISGRVDGSRTTDYASDKSQSSVLPPLDIRPNPSLVAGVQLTGSDKAVLKKGRTEMKWTTSDYIKEGFHLVISLAASTN